MFASVILFAVGLVLLIYGGDWFVDGATGIAKRFRLPDIVVGATVVSRAPAQWPMATPSAPSSATPL